MTLAWLTIAANAGPILQINEMNGDPGALVHSDCSGAVSRLNDEFVEMTNIGDSTVDLSAATVSDLFTSGGGPGSVQYTFPANTFLDPGETAIAFGSAVVTFPGPGISAWCLRLPAGCPTQSRSAGRLVPLVVYGTTAFDATEVDTADFMVWNGSSPSATFTDDVDSDGRDDWIGHFAGGGVVLGTGSSTFTAHLASSQRVLAEPAVTFGSVSDGDSEGIDDNCDQCPAVSGSGAFGCP